MKNENLYARLNIILNKWDHAFSNFMWHLDQISDVLRSRRSFIRNHNNEEMYDCFRPALPFKDVCLSFRPNNFLCYRCYINHDMKDYIE